MKKILFLLAVWLAIPTLAFAAVAFDGTGDEERIVDPNIGNTIWTVCGWFKWSTFVDGETVAYYGNGTDSSAGRGFSLDEQNDDASHGKVKMRMVNGASGTVMTTPQLTTNTWYHICWVGRGSPDSQVYIDATDATPDGTTDTDAFAAENSTDDIVIGTTFPASTGIGANDSAAKVAHFGMWNIALTGAQVASMADKSTCPTAVQAANLKVFMALDAAGSGTTTDSNAWTYTESGNPTTDAGPGGLPCGGGGGTGGTVESTLKAMGYH